LLWITGVEWLYNHAVIEDRGNRKGIPDTLQFIDQIYANQWTAYSQIRKDWHNTWHLDAGISLNQQQFRYQRTSVPLSPDNKKYRHRSCASRINFTRSSSKYGSIRHRILRIFTTFCFGDQTLGWKLLWRPAGRKRLEYGIRHQGIFFQDRLKYDIAWYHFLLKDAIVRRNNAAGAEYFVNAGSAMQAGLEAALQYQFIKKSLGWIREGRIQINYSDQPYHFIQYRQLNADYSGNPMTGVPAKMLSSGFSIETRHRWVLHASLQAVSSIPLTDAGDAMADPYQLLQLKLERTIPVKK